MQLSLLEPARGVRRVVPAELERPIIIVKPLDGSVSFEIKNRPEKVLLGVLGDPQLRLRRPIPVDISVDAGTVVAASAELEEFGYGDSLSAALEDLGKTVAQLFLSLSKDESRLGGQLTDVLRRVRDNVEPRRTK